jgi:hypothetical protein
MGAPDSPVRATPTAGMDDEPSQANGRPVGPRIGPDAAGSDGPAPASHARMAVVGADRTPICDRIADGTHPGPASGGNVATPDASRAGRQRMLSNPQSGQVRPKCRRSPGRYPTGTRSVQAGRWTRAIGARRTHDTLEMGAHTADAPTPQGGEASAAVGGPGCHEQ